MEFKIMTDLLEAELPKNYTQLNETLDAAEKILDLAVNDSRTLFHTPVVSSFKNKIISSRVMVLREFSLKERKMRFHTDYRAPKIDQYSSSQSATVIGYDPKLKIQIKLQGEISVYHNNAITKSAWEQSSARSKKCYSVKGGSSKKIENPENYDIKDFEAEEGYQNFAVLIFTFNVLEFLYLKSTGHRRAIHKWDNKLSSTWLIP